nr:MAG TPA: hypothetical protein [Caudoviricetes sp.]
MGSYRLWLITSRNRNWSHVGSIPSGPTQNFKCMGFIDKIVFCNVRM